MTHEIQLNLGYTNTSYANKFTIGNVAESIASDAATVKNKIQDINTALAEGTDDGLADFIVSNNYDGTVGKLRAIESAVIVSEQETVIYPAE